eukprot:CAMPEP_0204824982 /NCGR_PEP_ID=MMETSP1346-20131115/2956_1 /ASSEMBLY_ACC=CAM_ASM_000771 /TAXON_ID=215587 /ORGANISM="Aplanochytrium stocchinoi, Strain GSBS06" /LENGTH=564 /DNA_ID=CAMNT_0051952439 /DNA_START=22 /DNA_END=1716 /DNA_ORIENTATION=-
MSDSTSPDQADAFTESETVVSYMSGGHRYRIKTFSAAKKTPAKSLSSTNFKIGKHEWQIVCYPGGETEEVSQFVSLFLGYRGPDPQCDATWMLRCVNQDTPADSRERVWAKGDRYNTFNMGRRWGWQKFLKRELLTDPDRGFLKDDTIIFETTVDIHTRHSTVSKPWSGDLSSPCKKLDLFPIPPGSLGNDFSNLFHSENLADVMFILDDGLVNLKGHSQILAARSPVFAKSFEHYFTHSHGGSDLDKDSEHSKDQKLKYTITILDIDSRVFKELLRFIYCDKLWFLEERLSGNKDELSPDVDVDLVTPVRRTIKRSCTTSYLGQRRKRKRKRQTQLEFHNDTTTATSFENDNGLVSKFVVADEVDSDKSGGDDDDDDDDDDDIDGGLDSEAGEESHYHVGGRSFVMALLEAADKYELNRLRLLCEHHLCDTLDNDTVCDTLVLADKHSATRLKKKCMDYISDNATLIIVSEGFKNLEQSLVAELFGNLAARKSPGNTMLTVGQRASGCSSSQTEEPEHRLSVQEIIGMHTAGLRKACTDRGLATTGTRPVLIHRLTQFLSQNP